MIFCYPFLDCECKGNTKSCNCQIFPRLFFFLIVFLCYVFGYLKLIFYFCACYLNVQYKNLKRFSMSISKTRQKLVDVARQLFAKNGIANTTMNDIAIASGKGRRTLYTYFNRKEDVYSAVIESELERLSDRLDEVACMKMRPQDKIIELIYTHLSMIRETVVRNGNLRAEFFRNIWMVEKVRKNFDEDELEIFRRCMQREKKRASLISRMSSLLPTLRTIASRDLRFRLSMVVSATGSMWSQASPRWPRLSMAHLEKA